SNLAEASSTGSAASKVQRKLSIRDLILSTQSGTLSGNSKPP
ncbi:unnamed protein product, partial [Tilletia caries]